MIFYCIIRSENDITNRDTYRLLQSACKDRGVEFVPLEADTLNYATVRDEVVAGSLLYRLAGGGRASLLEALLSDKVITLRKNIDALLSREFDWGSAIRLQHVGVPIIPTIFNVSRLHDAQLPDYVERLGGFPVVLKSAGGSHGAGVMIIDSIESLRSVLDFASDQTTNDMAIRRYIKNARHLRLVVLGDEVLDVIEYLPQPDDFRTNAVHTPKVEGRTDIDQVIIDDAVRAVQTLGFEFGGVDVLIDEDGQYFIAEVNHPCNFARNQLNTGVDIAGAMVDFLVRKQNS